MVRDNTELNLWTITKKYELFLIVTHLHINFCYKLDFQRLCFIEIRKPVLSCFNDGYSIRGLAHELISPNLSGKGDTMQVTTPTARVSIVWPALSRASMGPYATASQPQTKLSTKANGGNTDPQEYKLKSYHQHCVRELFCDWISYYSQLSYSTHILLKWE